MWILNSGLHDYKTSTLLTELPPSYNYIDDKVYQMMTWNFIKLSLVLIPLKIYKLYIIIKFSRYGSKSSDFLMNFSHCPSIGYEIRAWHLDALGYKVCAFKTSYSTIHYSMRGLFDSFLVPMKNGCWKQSIKWPCIKRSSAIVSYVS